MPDASPINYNEIAREYGSHRRPHPGVLEIVFELAERARDGRVLEVGAGTGNYALRIGERHRSSVTGIDPSAAMLAQVPGSGGIERVLGRAEMLPFRDEAFALVYSVDVIHHIVDRTIAAKEAARVLQPGGVLAIATDSEDDLARRIPLSSHFPETVEAERRRYPTIGTIRAELAGAGFREFEERHVLFTYPMSNIRPYRDKAFSSLHLISDSAFVNGLERMERDLAAGPIAAESHYTLLVALR